MKKTKFNPELLKEELNRFKSINEYSFGMRERNLDDDELILTFKLSLPDDKSLNLKDLFPSAVIIHKKGNALYTINALNKLIDEKAEESIGNIEYKDVKINWEEYQDKFILIKDKELKILNISRVF